MEGFAFSSSDDPPTLLPAAYFALACGLDDESGCLF